MHGVRFNITAFWTIAIILIMIVLCIITSLPATAKDPINGFPDDCRTPGYCEFNPPPGIRDCADPAYNCKNICIEPPHFGPKPYIECGTTLFLFREKEWFETENAYHDLIVDTSNFWTEPFPPEMTTNWRLCAYPGWNTLPIACWDMSDRNTETLTRHFTFPEGATVFKFECPSERGFRLNIEYLESLNFDQEVSILYYMYNPRAGKDGNYTYGESQAYP